MEITDNEDVSSEETATVDYLREVSQENLDHVADLKRRAQSMFEQVTLPVRNGQGTIIGGAVFMECRMCFTVVRPLPRSVIGHMSDHLRRERRGEYSNG